VRSIRAHGAPLFYGGFNFANLSRLTENWHFNRSVDIKSHGLELDLGKRAELSSKNILTTNACVNLVDTAAKLFEGHHHRPSSL